MATAEHVDAIEVENLGPIRNGRFPTLPRGGVVQYTGPQGCGKSTMLSALESAATGKGKIPLRDGASKGMFKGFGVEIKLNPHRNTRTGEPMLEFIDGKLSIADIVDPGVQDPAAADAKRIKALVQLAGGEPDPAVFSGLFGNDATLFASIVDESVADLADLVAMAEKVKRDCEKAAREEEKAADTATGKATALKQTADGIDTTAESDSAKLQAELEAAIRGEAQVIAEVKAAEKAMLDRRAAIKAIEDAEAESQLPAMSVARSMRDSAAKAVAETEVLVENLSKQLIAAKGKHADAQRDLDNREGQIRAVKEFDAAMEAWRAVVEATDSVELVEAEKPRLAAERVVAARNAMEAGVAARKALSNLASAKDAQAEADKHATAAKTLRSIAGKTDDVLSAQVAKLGTPLRVDDGRLLLTTDRGPTFFGELSDGQRWKLALDIAIDVLGENGLIVIPQWAWGELQPANKKAIAEQARERGVLIYTAVATDGEGIEANEYV